MTEDSTRPLLQLMDLWVDIGGVQILRGVSLEVPAGSTVSLIGRNGAGKTTTLRAVVGAIPARRGALRLAGKDLNALPAHLRPRAGIGYAPEDRRLVTALSVAENLELPAYACGLATATRRERLERVYALLPEIEPLLRRPAGALSGGQQKIVALARALVVGVRLLLLDEPFQGLAPALAARYAQALTDLRARDRSLAILVTESNPQLLESISQSRYVIERGALVAAGAARE